MGQCVGNKKVQRLAVLKLQCIIILFTQERKFKTKKLHEKSWQEIKKVPLRIITHLGKLERPFSTQENKHRIGSDLTFFVLYCPHRRNKKVENTLTFYHWIIGSNWNRKLVPKAHARVLFCSDPVRCLFS